MLSKTGVYKIVNKINNKTYYGKTRSAETREKLSKGKHWKTINGKRVFI